ncbi:hypothetical protein, variant [Blastomyces gilchristii SLH14081]|uniref:Uncharacterized protein n=1 Tax=Blastomyces gilchristii (strain SLH14081) TaxID=559298 RepID=A0A179UPZ7_BLAGS|nr:uncharacterized protein BDBG_04662 [Blastomyces gilchristii SLH14081]XP_031578646.1 hypothetical protein, variant [Blastomyces gilchristii SLH14081]OAT09100.1 hypothetical protein BDBG_04662 [Blastomyces gilchristii SLH14081]OAT09101.1 hypothetical protein, variant [Blastomyces gilchristii SLH14081]
MAQALVMEAEGPERIDNVMVVVLENLRDVTEHLRNIHRRHAANCISKYTQHIIAEFGRVMLDLTDADMVMYPSENKANGTVGNVDANNCRDECGEILMEVCEPDKKSLIDRGVSKPAPMQGKLWSNIAAAAPPPQAACQTNGLHGMAPRKPKGNIIPLVPIFTMVPAMPRQIMPPSATMGGMGGGGARAGIVTVEGKFALDSLNMLTARIREGALYSVEIHHHSGFAEITFQYATHAKEFLVKDKHATASTGYGCFGNGFRVRHDKYRERAWDADLKKMSNGLRERRRLTFSRTKLLMRPNSFRVMEEDLERIAGPDGIDFVWKFNTGNVTAVFKSVRTARLVRVSFLQKASRSDSQFAGVSVDYSSDPCEKQLTLTQNGVRFG